MANLSSYLPDGIDESNVAITGGSINGTTIGASTAAAGTFTAFTSNGIDDNADATAITIDSSENVGIGTASPSTTLQVNGTSRVTDGTTNIDAVSAGGVGYFGTQTNHPLVLRTNDTERMRITTGGTALIGKTSEDNSTVGCRLNASGDASFVADGNRALVVVRKSSDGEMALFLKDSTTIGTIRSVSSQLVIHGAGTDSGVYYGSATWYPWKNGAFSDNVIDLGYGSGRFDDVYATNGTIQTSDRNEKQDIEELTEAEQRVAVAAKALLRKFRWKSAVRTKSHDARIHFGIIAQDLQAAFEAEGLDAGDYGMFICSEWWETYTDVPAVQAVEAQDAVYDEEGNLVSEAVEAVEAVEAYTRTDTYNTEAEAPEGAVRKERMGVRYSELLAFIIAAI